MKPAAWLELGSAFIDNALRDDELLAAAKCLSEIGVAAVADAIVKQ